MNYFDTFLPAHRLPSKAHLQQKLHPNRFPDMPRVLAAVVADAEYVQQPKICEIAVTNDGGVFARIDHEPRLEHYIADYGELLQGWRTLMAMARLSPAERPFADSLFAERVGIYEPDRLTGAKRNTLPKRLRYGWQGS